MTRFDFFSNKTSHLTREEKKIEIFLAAVFETQMEEFKTKELHGKEFSTVNNNLWPCAKIELESLTRRQKRVIGILVN